MSDLKMSDRGITEEKLAEMERRLQAATPGPWKSYVEGRDHTSGSDFIMTGEEPRRGPDIELSGATVAGQDFIASAREDIELLIAEVRRLGSLLARRA